MAAGGEQRDVGKRHVMLEVDRQQMGFEMIDADERNPGAKRHAFDQRHADQQRADQPGAVGHREAIDIGQGRAGVFQGAVDDRQDILNMLARRQFRHHAAIGPMHAILRRDHIGEDRLTVL